MTRIPSPFRLLDTLSARLCAVDVDVTEDNWLMVGWDFRILSSLSPGDLRHHTRWHVWAPSPLFFSLTAPPPQPGRTTTHTHLRSTSALVRWPNGCVMLNVVVRGSHVNGQIEDEFVDDKNINLIISSKSTFSYKINPIPFLLKSLDSIFKVKKLTFRFLHLGCHHQVLKSYWNGMFTMDTHNPPTVLDDVS